MAWHRDKARASAASAGLGGSDKFKILVTMAVTWDLSARPYPVTAAFTSVGVYVCVGRLRRTAHSRATALACAVPMAVRTFTCEKTRSTATTSGWINPENAHVTPNEHLFEYPTSRRGRFVGGQGH